MILELHRQGVSVSAIARQVGLDRKTVHKYIERGLEPPMYGPRPRRVSKIAPFSRYLRERLAAFPQLTGRRLHRELRELGYTGGYSILTDFLRDIRPNEPAPFEVRFETPPGRQGQVDFAHFRTVFTDEPGTERILWLFSLVPGHRGHRTICSKLIGWTAPALPASRCATVVAARAPQMRGAVRHASYSAASCRCRRHNRSRHRETN
jgi:transposase